jgi:peptide/nickel transport system permease protein
MIRYLALRGIQAVPVLIGISIVAFFLIRIVPGDPIRTMLGSRATEESIAILRAHYGLDQPLPIQYLTFLAGVGRLDLGDSIALHRPVTSLIATRVWPTVILISYATVISFFVAVPLATYSAVKANRIQDQSIRLVMMVTFAMPAFWLGLILILIFSLNLHLFPASGLGEGPLPLLWSLTLPAITIGLYLAPVLIRTLRASMIESLKSDHVEAARARGIPDRVILRRHVFRTSLIATVTIVGVNLGFLISGSVIVENVFAIPGIGSLLVNAVATRDFPLIQGIALFLGVAVVLLSLGTDLLNVTIDPRIRT